MNGSLADSQNSFRARAAVFSFQVAIVFFIFLLFNFRGLGAEWRVHWDIPDFLDSSRFFAEFEPANLNKTTSLFQPETWGLPADASREEMKELMWDNGGFQEEKKIRRDTRWFYRRGGFWCNYLILAGIKSRFSPSWTVILYQIAHMLVLSLGLVSLATALTVRPPHAKTDWLYGAFWPLAVLSSPALLSLARQGVTETYSLLIIGLISLATAKVFQCSAKGYSVAIAVLLAILSGALLFLLLITRYQLVPFAILMMMIIQASLPTNDPAQKKLRALWWGVGFVTCTAFCGFEIWQNGPYILPHRYLKTLVSINEFFFSIDNETMIKGTRHKFHKLGAAIVCIIPFLPIAPILFRKYSFFPIKLKSVLLTLFVLASLFIVSIPLTRNIYADTRMMAVYCVFLLVFLYAGLKHQSSRSFVKTVIATTLTVAVFIGNCVSASYLQYNRPDSFSLTTFYRVREDTPHFRSSLKILDYIWSHTANTPDEKCLILCSDSRKGLAVYRSAGSLIEIEAELTTEGMTAAIMNAKKDKDAVIWLVLDSEDQLAELRSHWKVREHEFEGSPYVIGEIL